LHGWRRTAGDFTPDGMSPRVRRRKALHGWRRTAGDFTRASAEAAHKTERNPGFPLARELTISYIMATGPQSPLQETS
jgi:hypothetical protein